MLPNSSHWRFAPQRDPFREAHFLCFADSTQNDQKGPEQGPLTPDGNEKEQSPEQRIESMQEAAREGNEMLEILERQQLVQESLATPVGLTEVLGETLEQEEFHALAQKVREEEGATGKRFAVDARLYERVKKSVLEKPAIRLEAETMLMEKFSDTQNVVKFTRGLEERLSRYTDLSRQLGELGPTVGLQLGSVTLEKYEKLDEEFRQWSAAQSEEHGGAQMEVIDFRTWMKTQNVADICKKLGIDPAFKPFEGMSEEQAEDLRVRLGDATIRGNYSPSKDVGQNEQATKDSIALRLETAARAKQRLANMQLDDGFAVNEQLDYRSETVEKLRERVLRLRSYIDKRIQSRAQQLEKRTDALLQDWQTRYGKDFDAIGRGLGISGMALLQRLADLRGSIAHMRREAKAIDAETGMPMEDADPQNLASTESDAYLTAAETTLKQLDEFERNAQNERTLTAELRRDFEEASAWVADRARRIRSALDRLKGDPLLRRDMEELFDAEVLEALLGSDGEKSNLERVAEMGERFAAGNETPEDRDNIFDELSSDTQKSVDRMLTTIESPGALQRAKADKDIVQKHSFPENSDAVRDELRRRLEVVAKRLQPDAIPPQVRDHEVFKMLNIGGQMTAFMERISTQIVLAAKLKQNHLASTKLKGCALNIEKLYKLAEELQELSSANVTSRIVELPPHRKEEYKRYAGTDASYGCYRRKDGKIYLNMDRIRAKKKNKQEVIDHELGHALLDTLMRRTGLLPDLFVNVRNRLEMRTAEGENTYLDLLRKQQAAWHFDRARQAYTDQEYERLKEAGIGTDAGKRRGLAEKRAEALCDELLIDELINKYASWKQKGDDSTPNELRKLFAVFENDQPAKGPPSGVSLADQLNFAIPEALDEEALHDTTDVEAEDAPAAGPGETTLDDLHQQTRDLKRRLLNAREYGKNYNDSRVIAWVDDMEKEFENRIEKPFNQGTLKETDALALMAVFLENSDKSFKAIEEAQGAQLLSTAGGGGGGFLGYTIEVDFVSILDLIEIGKQVGEDVKRMWKRRGERVQSKIGARLTDWIPDNNIWGLTYMGQLKHEFNRRSSASELTEVKQWKDSLTDVDSYGLQQMLDGTKNKDQLRAILELLTERGRLDWNDLRFWDTLNAICNDPSARMNTAACMNDDVVRDKQLQRVITAIWGDKEHFYNWRRGNDNAYASEMEKFTSQVDQFSNVTGGLNGELKHQLQVWKQCQKDGTPIPETVNPHLYEKIILYAISNGKMRMEDKFYYLIQGVATGLLSIDRIRVLAGEKGGILLRFPVIDYFYKKNNSLPEIKAMAERLDEKNPKKPDEPGPKTTMFLLSEVMREESTRQRIAKATDRQAEGFDHEDIPLFISHMTYGQVETLGNVISGSRQKGTREGWKNAYIGFNTRFKAFARLANMEDESLTRLTKADGSLMADSIVSYLHMDNFLTRNGYDDAKTRPKLDKAEFETSSPSAGKGYRVLDYREAAHGFVGDLVQKLENAGVFNWKADVSKDIEMKDYVKMKLEDPRDKGQAEKIFNATTRFNAVLKKALESQQGLAILKSVAKGHATGLIEEHRDKGEKEWLSEDAAKRYIKSHEEVELAS